MRRRDVILLLGLPAPRHASLRVALVQREVVLLGERASGNCAPCRRLQIRPVEPRVDRAAIAEGAPAASAPARRQQMGISLHASEHG